MQLRTQSLKRNLSTCTLMKKKEATAAVAGVVVLLVIRECEMR
jgi:hypothetical protein